ncbi:hypothetical protein TPCU411_02260 [Cutibacterium acnes]|nr:hypothetical protein TPCU411_02260 [Cutibacterium acnes]
MFKTLQKIGKAFMLPIAILPAAGLLLGIGGALSNPTTVKSYPVLDNPILQDIFQVMSAAGNVIFENLALLLSIGLCIGLAKRDKGTAALAGITGFLVMTATTKALVVLSRHPDRTIDTGVVGSLVIGAVAVWLHNRYHNIELPAFLGFFGGSRFVPIVTAFAGIIIGAFFFVVWPPIQAGMVSAGTAIADWGVIGTFFYGFLMRLAGAVGLHHMIYPMFWYTPLGGTEAVAGKTVVGAQKIFFAQLADPNHVGLFTHSTKYFAGRFATMMFGLPGACLAMWRCVPKGRRAKYTGLFASVAFTSFLTGITEPIEYMFLFVAPCSTCSIRSSMASPSWWRTSSTFVLAIPSRVVLSTTSCSVCCKVRPRPTGCMCCLSARSGSSSTISPSPFSSRNSGSPPRAISRTP